MVFWYIIHPPNYFFNNLNNTLSDRSESPYTGVRTLPYAPACPRRFAFVKRFNRSNRLWWSSHYQKADQIFSRQYSFLNLHRGRLVLIPAPNIFSSLLDSSLCLFTPDISRFHNSWFWHAPRKPAPVNHSSHRGSILNFSPIYFLGHLSHDRLDWNRLDE